VLERHHALDDRLDRRQGKFNVARVEPGAKQLSLRPDQRERQSIPVRKPTLAEAGVRPERIHSGAVALAKAGETPVAASPKSAPRFMETKTARHYFWLAGVIGLMVFLVLLGPKVWELPLGACH
jgi:hypothetical protein